MKTVVNAKRTRLSHGWAALSWFCIICCLASCNSRRESKNEPALQAVQDSSASSPGKSGRSRPPVKDVVLGVVPEFELQSQTGDRYAREHLHGKTWVASFISTGSTEAASRQTELLARLQQRLERHRRWDEIRFVTFTLDPQQDSAAELSDFARQAGADGNHWKFLTGSPEAISQLRSAGFQLPDEDSGQLGLVDPYYRVRGLYDASEEGLAALEDDLKTVVRETVLRPDDILAPAWLEARQQAQLETAAEFDVFHGFQFSDRRQESGIGFRNKIVDDAGKSYKAVHYDHGNGVSIADVDGDGRLDVYFITQAGPNELWRNLGGGKFANITESAGVAVADRIGVTASFADTDNDGDADLYVTTVRGGNVFFQNDGSGKFTDISLSSGLDHVGHSSSAVFFDYDRDGLLDVLLCNVGRYTADEQARVTMQPVRGEPQDVEYDFYVGLADAFAGHVPDKNRNERSLLFRNLGGNQFQDVTEPMNLVDESWTGAATPVDFNQDGWLDLYLLNMQGHDQYYVNRAGQRFEKQSREVFPQTPWGAMGVKAFDYDNDGDQDLLITDMHSDMSEEVPPKREKLKADMQWDEEMLLSGGMSIWGNALFRQEADGSFVEVSQQLGAENYWPWGLSVGDLNADGFADVFIASSMNYPFRYGVNTVLLNDRGKKFRDAEFILGIEPRSGPLAEPWFELDLDGTDREHPLARGRSGRVVVWSAKGTRSSVIFDIDDDGDLDIVTNEFNSWPLVLVSSLSESKPDLRYLQVTLVGSKSNRDGLGATVQVQVAGQTFTQVHDGQSGYLSQSSQPLYFGLGEADEVDSIQVTWPSGIRQEVAGPIQANQRLEITEMENN